MQHDKDNPEDMDTDGEDHGVDDVRYASLSRPWARPTPPQKEERPPAPAGTTVILSESDPGRHACKHVHPPSIRQYARV
jgi:hypothetical protein